MSKDSTNNRNTGIVLIGLGILFIFMRISGFTMMSLLWPLWVLVPGAVMLYMAFSGERANPGWAVPGAIVGGTGAILFTLNLTGRWEAWSYAWALYPTLIGSALYYTGKQNGDADMMAGGKSTATFGLYMLISFGLFFELLIFGGLGFLDSAILPVLLIAAGAFFLFGKDRIAVNVPLFTSDKPKRKLSDPDTGINPDLRRKIDEAIAEEEAV